MIPLISLLLFHASLIFQLVRDFECFPSGLRSPLWLKVLSRGALIEIGRDREDKLIDPISATVLTYSTDVVVASLLSPHCIEGTI